MLKKVLYFIEFLTNLTHLSKTPLSKIAPELMLHIRHSCYTFYIKNQIQNGCQSAILSISYCKIRCVKICIRKSQMTKFGHIYLRSITLGEALNLNFETIVTVDSMADWLPFWN